MRLLEISQGAKASASDMRRIVDRIEMYLTDMAERKEENKIKV
jgi:hypothetical protein